MIHKWSGNHFFLFSIFFLTLVSFTSVVRCPYLVKLVKSVINSDSSSFTRRFYFSFPLLSSKRSHIEVLFHLSCWVSSYHNLFCSPLRRRTRFKGVVIPRLYFIDGTSFISFHEVLKIRVCCLLSSFRRKIEEKVHSLYKVKNINLLSRNIYLLIWRTSQWFYIDDYKYKL